MFVSVLSSFLAFQPLFSGSQSVSTVIWAPKIGFSDEFRLTFHEIVVVLLLFCCCWTLNDVVNYAPVFTICGLNPNESPQDRDKIVTDFGCFIGEILRFIHVIFYSICANLTLFNCPCVPKLPIHFRALLAEGYGKVSGQTTRLRNPVSTFSDPLAIVKRTTNLSKNNMLLPILTCLQWCLLLAVFRGLCISKSYTPIAT